MNTKQPPAGTWVQDVSDTPIKTTITKLEDKIIAALCEEYAPGKPAVRDNISAHLKELRYPHGAYAVEDYVKERACLSLGIKDDKHEHDIGHAITCAIHQLTGRPGAQLDDTNRVKDIMNKIIDKELGLGTRSPA